MTDLVRTQTLMLSCQTGNEGNMTQYLKLGHFWFNILNELHTKQTVFLVTLHNVKGPLKVLVDGVGSSKIAIGI